jgi:hypothetical protein
MPPRQQSTRPPIKAQHWQVVARSEQDWNSVQYDVEPVPQATAFDSNFASLAVFCFCTDFASLATHIFCFIPFRIGGPETSS